MDSNDEETGKLRDALDLAMRRLMAFPASRAREELVMMAQSIGRELDAGRADDALRMRIAALHVVLAKAPPRRATKR